jgi:hypothetical protein
MEVKRPEREGRLSARGSGPGVRRQRSDALGPRKDVIIRMPEDEATQLKAVAALERTTVQEFVLQAIRPELERAARKHGIAK